MTTKDEALKLALEPVMSVYITKDGIEDWWHKLPEGRYELGDITAIREALAEQPAPEPTTKQKVDAAVEQYAKTGNGRVLEATMRQIISNEALNKMAENARELGLDYIRPAEIPQSITCPFCESQHVPGWLHDYNMDRMKKPTPPPECQTDAEKTAFAFGWWKALEENRKQPAQQQEPVAWMIWTHGPVLVFMSKDEANMEFDRLNHAYPEPTRMLVPLYTSPPIEATPLASQRSVKPWVGLTDEEAIFLIENECLGRGDLVEAIEAKLREKNEPREKNT